MLQDSQAKSRRNFAVAAVILLTASTLLWVLKAPGTGDEALVANQSESPGRVFVAHLDKADRRKWWKTQAPVTEEAKEEDTEDATTEEPSTTEVSGVVTVKVACVGDSITYGNGTHVNKKQRDFEGNYPLELQSMIKKRGCPALERRYGATKKKDIKFKIKNFGNSGKTATDSPKKYSYRRTKEYNRSLDYNPDVVVLLLGTNDSKDRHWVSQENFVSHLSWILHSYVSNFQNRTAREKKTVKKQVLLESNQRLRMLVQAMEAPPVSSSRRDGTVWDISEVRVRNPIKKGVAKALAELSKGDDALVADFSPSIPLYDMWETTLNQLETRGLKEANDLAREHPERGKEIPGLHDLAPAEYQRAKVKKAGGQPTLLSHDGVHPSVLGHQLIAFTVYESLCKGLVLL